MGFEALRDELQEAPLLRERQRELGQVLDSLVDEEYYVAICGALPLIEYVISKAAGRWAQPRKHLVEARRRWFEDRIGDRALVLDASAVQMVLEEVPGTWKPGHHQVGAVVEELNRHYVVHGTGQGWDDVTNATRAVLLLAPAARVGDALFQPDAGAAAA